MKVRLTLLTLLISCILNNYGQQLTFQKTFGGIKADDGKAIQQTTDGGYILAGQVHTISADSVDLCLIRTNQNGDTLWTRLLGGSLSDWANAVQQTNDGGFIVAGGTFSYGANNELIFLNKLDVNGNLSWSKTIGGSNINDAYSIQQTTDDGFIISGVTLSYGTGAGDLYLVKTNNLGDTLWTHTYGSAAGLEYGSFVRQTSDNGYIITGFTTSFGTATDIYLVKTDINGSLQWTKSIGGSGYDRANSVVEIPGGYIIGGYTSSFGSGGHDALLMKTDANGNVLWSKAYGTAGTERAYGIKQTSDGGFVLSGFTNINNGDVYLIKTDGAGVVDWSKSFGGPNNDWAWDVIQSNDGGYVCLRGSSSFGTGNSDIYMIKTDGSGNSGCNGADFPTVETSQLFTSLNTASITAGGGDILTINPSVKHGVNITTQCTTMELETSPAEVELVIYPNPFVSYLYISIQSGIEFKNLEFRIFDMFGTEVQRVTGIRSNMMEIKANDLPVGIYFYTLLENGITIASGKLAAE